MIFSSAFEAYQWAQETLDRFRNGMAFNPDPDRFRGTMGKHTAILTAIDINHLAQKACHGGHPCPHYHGGCFMGWYIPDPLVQPPHRSRAQTERIERCVLQFEIYLRMRRYIE